MNHVKIQLIQLHIDLLIIVRSLLCDIVINAVHTQPVGQLIANLIYTQIDHIL